MNRSRRDRRGPPHAVRPLQAGFSLLELMSAIAILSTVMSLALPALQSARESSRTSTCASHLKQIGIAHAAYVARNRAGMAASDWRRNALMDMEGSRPSLLCPTDARNDLFDINDYAVYIVNNKRTIPLEPGPWCALGDTAFCEQFSGIKLPTPDSFFLVFEDMAYNSPFDGMILAQPLPQGAWKLSHVGSNPHSYRHQLRDPLGVIIADPFAKGFTWTVQGIPTSYGMNSRSARFTTDPYKVLALDYATPVADVVGPTATGVVTWWRDVGSRHLGLTNVLYGDGRVARVDASEIDPTSPAMHDQSWCPTIDERLLLTRP
ncbi:MAG: prepilin-type N-terminal cleavage/methylation domain-containing protein [Planctomycetia bacterium]|nr:prepilin-type N-terminal cleavage/methylation domain-containing protein [Planctomycetia bacterium]